MTVVKMPGRFNGGARVDTRNCYVADTSAREAELVARAARARRAQRIEDGSALPSSIWTVLVFIVAVGSFAAGLMLGHAS